MGFQNKNVPNTASRPTTNAQNDVPTARPAIMLPSHHAHNQTGQHQSDGNLPQVMPQVLAQESGVHFREGLESFPVVVGKQDTYQLSSPIDRNGRIHYAVGQTTGLEVVVKSYETVGGFVCERDRTQELFERERIMQCLFFLYGPHQNICQAKEIIGHAAGKNYIVLPYLRGGDLAASFKQFARIEPKQMARVVSGVCDGLTYLHRRGLVHRDVKPSNILLDITDPTLRLTKGLLNSETVTAKISDFELGLHFATQQFEDEEMVYGTPAYVAPEVWNRDRPDPRTDIYAAGITIYAGLTGKLPFSQKTSTQWMHAHCSGKVPDPRTLSDKITGPVCDVIAKSLEKDPDRRYQTARELKEAYLNAIEMIRT